MRICATGRIIEIHEDKSGKASNGLLRSYSGTLYHFEAFGSSGTLTERGQGRFCGFVVGQFHYRNSGGGGVGHAVDVLGVWDFPKTSRRPDEASAEPVWARCRSSAGPQARSASVGRAQRSTVRDVRHAAGNTKAGEGVESSRRSTRGAPWRTRFDRTSPVRAAARRTPDEFFGHRA